MNSLRYLVAAAAALLLFASIAAHAAISDCEELKQPAIKEQLDKCVAHAACNFVLSSKPDCAEGRRFLERTKGNALNQLTRLFERNKALSANDVYETNLPEVDHPQDWKDRFAAIRDRVAQSGTEVLSGKLNDGTTWLYQGDVQDGKRHGWGVIFWGSGGMHRGQFAQDWRTGQGENSALNGYRAVGMYVNNYLNGEAWERLRDGARKKGNYAKGKLEGAGSLLFPSGNSYTGNFIGNDFNGRGTFRWADGSSFEGNFTNDKMDGQGTYTSRSGERSSRTYNAGTLVADATPAAAAPVTQAAVVPVSPAAACERSYMTCSAICIAGGLAALLSRSRGDAAACADACSSSQQQCLAALAPAPVVASAPGPSQAPAPSGGGNLVAGANTDWKTRTLRAPAGFEMLVPSDVILGFGPRVDSNRREIVGERDHSSMRMAPGRDFEEARKNQWEVTSGGSTMQSRYVLKASDLTGKVQLGWVAWVQLSDWWPEGYGYPAEGVAFVAGAASLDEAVAEGFRLALKEYRKKSSGPIRTFFVQAGVSAKPDYELYRRLRTYVNYHAMPFSFDCDMPATAKDAQNYGFAPQVPETPEAFARYVRTERSREYLHVPVRGVTQGKRWYGCWTFFKNNPVSETSEPVFRIE